jgi:hypothetical protein
MRMGAGAAAALLGALALVALAAVGLQGPGRVALRGFSVPPEPKLAYSGPIYQGDGEWDYKVGAAQPCPLQGGLEPLSLSAPPPPTPPSPLGC